MVWNILNEPDRLSSQVLIAKYLDIESIFLAKLRRNCSYVWQGILKTMEKLRSGFHFQLGSENMSIWYDHWFEQGKLCNLVDYMHISYTMLKVHNIWEEGRWEFSKLATIIPNTLKNQVSKLDIPSLSTCSDCRIWKGNYAGTYPASSGYKWLSQLHEFDDDDDDDALWRWIWKMKAPAKMIFFVWLCLSTSN